MGSFFDKLFNRGGTVSGAERTLGQAQSRLSEMQRQLDVYASRTASSVVGTYTHRTYNTANEFSDLLRDIPAAGDDSDVLDLLALFIVGLRREMEYEFSHPMAPTHFIFQPDPAIMRLRKIRNTLRKVETLGEEIAAALEESNDDVQTEDSPNQGSNPNT